MLEISIRPSANTPGGLLDLLPNTVLDIERPSEAFDDEFLNGEFSLPIEIPWTDNNKLVLGFSERLENFINDKTFTWLCDVTANGYPELSGASFNLLSKKGELNYSEGTFTANITSAKGKFGAIIKNKTLRDYNYGPKITWSNYSSREFATRHAKGEFPQLNYLSFAPVVIQEYFDTQKNYYGEFLVYDTVNNIVPTGIGANDWQFGRPLSDNPDTPAAPGHVEYIDYRTIPFFNARFIIKQLLKEIGFAIMGTALESPLLNDLYIFNTRSIEQYNFGTKYDLNRKIVINKHLPNIPVADFLNKIFKFLNVYPTFPGGALIDLKDKSETIRIKNILDVTPFTLNSFTSDYLPEEERGGYTLDYEKDDDDQYWSEAVRDNIEEKTFVGQVFLKSQLDTIATSQPLTTDCIAYVEAENFYYIVSDATASPVKWSAYADRMHPLKYGNGNREVTIGAGTLATYMQLNEETGLYTRINKLASRQQGCYLNNKNQLIERPFSLRMFFIRPQTIAGNTYPVSFNHHTNSLGSTLTQASLALQIPNSLGAMHAYWQNHISNPETVGLELIASKKLMDNIAEHNLIMQNNVAMIPTQVKFSIPLSSTIEIKAKPI